ncbi:intein C-terminal splicing region/RHS repeat-associated core domain-containing protein [Actinosynnema pretiosum]|nr:intein C-terminal splicing region/RHS repeat-associated core domain-containing protein [Actinosynnema pretiosum]
MSAAARRKKALRAVALGVVLVLTTSTAHAVAAPARTGPSLPLLQQDKSVEVTPVTPVGTAGSTQESALPAPAVWPDTATSEVSFAATGGTPEQAAARATGKPIRATGTPVAIAPEKGRGGSGKVRVQVLDRKSSPGAVVFSLTDVGGVADTPLSVSLDYRAFASGYGGDYASRLRLVTLPDCALTTPSKDSCRMATPVEGARNNTEAGRLEATTTLETGIATSALLAGSKPKATKVFAAVAAAASSSGTYTATSLAPAGSWSAGGSAGDFSYGYPMRVPPAVAGGTPLLSLGYSAQSLDGRTSSTNNQASWAGDGWDISPGGFIERQYKPCALDLGGNNGQTKTGDQCWATDNATISLVGVSGKLVKDKTTGQWRAQNDDGARIERLTGAANGDNDGEHWKVTTPDGSQYFLGLNRLPGWASGKPETQSTWTTPVYGNNTGEPCNAGTFDASWCQQAYRWNLDYSVDPNGNVTTYYYEREFNHYGRNIDPAKGTQYVRGGYLSRVEYGLRSDAVYGAPTAKVDFETAERCVPGGSVTCAPNQIRTAPGSWPDVPADQLCDAGEKCTDRNSPAFFTTKRLTKVITRVTNGSGGWQDVDSWSLTHQFLPTGDGLSPSMNLTSVVHTGHVGGTIALPATTFTYKALDNRVNSSTDNLAPLTRHRIVAIGGEAGGHTQVEYSGPDCVAGSRMPASPESNTLRCYPTWWTPEGATQPILDWFHKYVVTTVVDDDRTGGSSLVKTKYDYLGDGAWHYDEADFADPNRRTWSQWRGYGAVRTTKGESPGVQTVTEVVYGRGMDGDKLPNNGTRTAWVSTSEGEPVRDVDRMRGFVRESRQYEGGKLVSASVNDPYQPDTPSSTDVHGNKAFVNGVAAVRGRTLLENGSWRRTQVNKAFNAEGIAVRVEDLGDLAVTGDESCTRTTYARNEAAWMITYAQQVETVVGTCSVTASQSTVQSLARSSYDGQASGVAPTRGLITKAEVLDKWDASGQSWITASRASYDAYGRPTEVWDANDQKTTTAYVPATGPVRELWSTNALGHVSKEHVESAWGASVASVDANNRRADLSYDALGRVTAAWLPGHAKGTAQPDAAFEYQYNTDRPTVVVSKQLQDNNQYLSSYTLYDGLLRERQTQSPAPNGGRIVADTFYDSRSLPTKVNGAYWNESAPGGGLVGVLDNAVPGQTLTEYDGMERPTAAIFRKLGVEQWRTTTAYGGDRVHSTPPSGGTATTIVSDAQGRTTEKRQYTAGLGSAFDATKYAYTASGLLSSVTDPAGNAWKYTYDLRGRLTATDDPDTGRSTSVYNAAGQVLSTTDSSGRTIANTYDKLGRQTGRYAGSLSGAKLAEWEYDTLAGGLGMQTLSRRFVDGQTYLTKTNGFDAGGRPTGVKVILPAAKEGVLGTTYELRQGYTYTGKPSVTTYVAVNSGGKQIVSQEGVGTYYNSMGLPEQLVGGSDVYVSQTSYSSYGEVLRQTYGNDGTGAENNVWVTNSYEIGTRRPESTVVDRETIPSQSRTVDRKYTFDPSGNITRISDLNDVQCFGYDHLRRLNEAWTPSSGDCAKPKATTALGGAAPYWQSWTFDKTGNRLTETQHATAGDTVRTTTYPAAGAPQPHTARSVTTKSPNTTAVDTFGYDASGRTTSRKIGGDTQTLEYDAEGRVSKVVTGGKASTYLYDADGTRLISREPSATTVHVFDQEIRLETGTSTPTWTRYYSHNGKAVAVRNSVTGLKWLIADHQGTNQLSISKGDLAVTQRRQTPYGALRGAAVQWPDKLGFVGGRNDESGLTQVGARLYDNASGRFLSADPIVDNNDPQQMNGYAYSNNSPVTMSDPTGMIVSNCGVDGLLCGGKRIEAIHGSVEQFNAARQSFKRAIQTQVKTYNAELNAGLRKKGISEEQHQQALKDANKTKWDVIKEVVWEAIKDISGWNDIVNCFSEGDIWACGGLVFGLVPWGKAGKIIEAGFTAFRAVEKLAAIVEKAKGVLRQVEEVVESAVKAVTERFRKVGGSCTLHSFVASTRVVMADGSEKPISEIELGDKVKATDPATGETADREVVGTLVHGDEGDMTELTVRAEDGSAGTVDATSWHPVWVNAQGQFVKIGDLKPGQRLTSADGTSPVVTDVRRYAHFEPVYDLTVEGVHTYYVVTGGVDFLVHNCGRSVDELYASGTMPLKKVGGDSVASRAYQKHSEGPDRLDTTLPVLNSGKDRRDIATYLIEDLLTNPKSVMRSWNHSDHGEIIELMLPDVGARWKASGQFIGFTDHPNFRRGGS